MAQRGHPVVFCSFSFSRKEIVFMLLAIWLIAPLVKSVLCSCNYYTCSYCGNCHNPNCRHRKPCTNS
jgi:hypothetical protein